VKQPKIYFNGKIIPKDRALVSVDDHGFLYGDGVYETIRAINGRPFLLKEHMQRLQTSANALRIKSPIPYAQYGRAIDQVLKANRLKEAGIRITLTRGPGPYGFDPRPCKNPTLVITAFPYVGHPLERYEKGMTLAVTQVRRNSPQSLPPWVKSTNCLNGILAKMESLKAGAHEALLLTSDGRLAEGSIFNVFVVKNGGLMTPALDGSLLAGVTRGRVCRLAREAGYPVKETRLPHGVLRTADEVFITSTLMDIMPVTKIVFVDGSKMKTFKGVGPVTSHLIHLFGFAKLPPL
jgi:branched-chain amino acid aminotransferase